MGDGNASRPATGGAGSSSSGAPPQAAPSLPSSVVSSGSVGACKDAGGSGPPERRRDFGRNCFRRDGTGVSGGRGNPGDGDASRPATGGAGSSSSGAPPQAAPSLPSSVPSTAHGAQAQDGSGVLEGRGNLGGGDASRPATGGAGSSSSGAPPQAAPSLPSSVPSTAHGAQAQDGSGVLGGRGNLGGGDASRPATGGAGSSSSGVLPQAAPSLPSSVPSTADGAQALPNSDLANPFSPNRVGEKATICRTDSADKPVDRTKHELETIHKEFRDHPERILNENDSSSDSSIEEIECNLDF
uniref:Uncharacterized protein n=1 Tax=Chromera velia CCMP2878 TaxID=1169474 RepID=A0A0G4HH51_9ALVE|eukprot:Cvel_27418.t1-p1 / transcript=Cvel_27418.t1 / gene=Cvel_27418 / organism=Chromera_velia_CCMP2878 / gene_product=hypothetical protein / transcript_product=hypothetical protein / location=Cvel_scaffold3417:6692-9288(+) / protein_length=298 / sequence_SO=supercontig / SO=protein_coding / is_pseudo=false